jgi:hypothetical protein
VTPALIGVHATQLEPAEIAALAAAGAASLLSRSNLKLASGACPVAELLRRRERGARHRRRSNNWLDSAELQTAALLAKHPPAIDRGARGRGDPWPDRSPRAQPRRQIGSLVVGGPRT